jgi:hypothetical protein
VPEDAVGPVELVGGVAGVVGCVDGCCHRAKSWVPPSKLGGDRIG